MSKIKPGCMAFIVAPYFEPAIGRVVEVLARYTEGEFVGGFVWRARYGSKDEVSWICAGRIPCDASADPLPVAVVLQSCLRPIRDSGDSVQDAHDILIPEHLREGETV